LKTRVVSGLVAIVFAASAAHAQAGWQQKLKEELPLMGHRNWIVVVDSAYPLQSGSGVETVETGSDQISVLNYVLDAIRNSQHVRPIVHTDAELAYVPESEAPGVGQYREQLKGVLAGAPVDSILHQTLIDRLNETGKSFHVLVLKTKMTIPYTSVFLQLDCKYWSSASEAKLRAAMKSSSPGSATSARP
jgi:hypothetical protein